MMLNVTRSTASGLYSDVANSTSGANVSALRGQYELTMDKAARTRHAASKFAFLVARVLFRERASKDSALYC